MHTPRTLLCSLGHVTVARRYYACRGCGAKEIPFDRWAGLEANHHLTVHAKRLVTLAGSTWSFDQAADKLREFCGLRTSNDVIRAVCNEEGEAIRKWMNRAPEMKQAFDAADGVVEFSTDGLTVMRKMKEMPVDDFFAPGATVRPDGRLMNDMLLAEVKLAYSCDAPAPSPPLGRIKPCAATPAARSAEPGNHEH